ncbi:MAG: sodium:alanine symporter family protein [Oscillospiraceae bacterium]|nr:sodium:alanine symporter family protein [Oscillospiraceae bacterium]
MDIILNRVQEIIWGPWTAALVVGAGVYFTCRSRGYQVRRLPRWWKATAGSMFSGKPAGGISQFQASTAVLAGTLGTGNIVGVATALTLGGPGAVFWMWVAAFFGMMISYCENYLGILYRKREGKHWLGGPMRYMEVGLKSKWLAGLFAACCALCAFGVGNLTQINSIAHAAESAFSAPRWSTGLFVALLAAPAILGGVNRVVKLTEKLVPFITIAYVLACLVVVGMHITALPGAFARIIREAFSAPAVAGGAMGAMLVGVRRGVFTNEAGMGSTVLVHAAADYDSPEEAGMWGIFEVFVDTLMMCTLTALAILTSGALGKTDGGGAPLDGAALAAEAFRPALGDASGAFMTVAALLFAFATIVAWSCFGGAAFSYISGGRYLLVYKLLYVGAIMLGAVTGLRTVWTVSDILNGLMLIPNLLAVILLSGRVFGKRPPDRCAGDKNVFT